MNQTSVDTNLDMSLKGKVAISMGLTGLVALFVFAFKGFFPLGRDSVMLTDMYSQYIPLLYRFYDVVGGQKNIFMEFDILCGANLFGDTINEILNPFNYILFLFGRDKIYVAVNIIFLAYMVCMSGTATYAINKLNENAGRFSIILGMCYALSGYTAYNYQIIKWMYLPVIFPLFFVALIEMLNGKGARKYTVLLAYQLVLSIQLGFMTLMFSLFAGGIYVWFCVKKEDRNKRLSYMGICTITGVLLSAFAVIPTVSVLLDSARSGQNQSYFAVMKQHGLDDIFERIYQVFHPVLIGLLIPVIKKSKNDKSKWLMWLTGLLWITIIAQPANLLWHMGSYVCFPVRYGYMVLFVMCLWVSEAYRDVVIDRKTIKIIVSSIISVVGIVAICIREDLITQAFSCLAISLVCPKEALYVFAIMVVMSVAAYFLRTNRLAIICLSCAWGVAALTMICLPKTAVIRSMNEQVYKEYKYEPVASFARVRETNEEHLNTGLITGKPSLSGYIPTGNGQYQQAMNKLGYTTNWVSVSAEGGNYDELLSQVTVGDAVVDAKDVIIDKRKAVVTINLPSYVKENDEMFVPIANVSGWSSNAGDIVAKYGGFIGIKLTNVNDAVVLKYRSPGVISGVVISLFGFLLLVLVLERERIRCNTWLAGLYKAVFVAGIAGIYIIPTVGMILFMSGKALGIVDSGNNSSGEYNFISAEEDSNGLCVKIAGNNLLQTNKVKITADSTEGGKKGKFVPEKVIDGEKEDRNSRWSSENDWENNDHYLCVDFRKPQTISFVRIFWERDNVNSYALEYSDNGNDWIVAKTYEGKLTELKQNICLEEKIEARYVRLHVTGVEKNEEDLSLYYQNVSVLEMEMYELMPEEILIKKPETFSDRSVNAEEFCENLPQGYDIVYSGCNYPNIIDNLGKISDTVDDTEVELGFTLHAGNEEYALPGLKVVVPGNLASDVNRVDSSRYFDDYEIPKETCLSDELTDGVTVEVCKSDTSENALGDEGYEIRITREKVIITANSDAGVSYANTTLNHLREKNNGSLPTGIIRDYPAYKIRGFGIDVGRRPITMELLYRIVDAMSERKMNTLIVHLNDNQIIANEHVSSRDEAFALKSGFRLESEMGVTSTDLYYTKEEFQQFISYSKKLGVNIVPEIDTPAHCLQFTKMYPKLALGSDPNSTDEMDLSKKETIEFAKNLWGEYIDTTFQECDMVHLGMDEYYGDGRDLVSYMNTMSDFAGSKDVMVWGSFSYMNANYDSVSRDITMQIWDTSWADPEEMEKAGFSLVNSLSCNLYLIPGTAYDNLDMDYLENKWEPYRFDTAEKEYVSTSWSPAIKGACYMLWNDFDVSVAGVLTEDELFDRFNQPLKVLAEKMW